MLTCDGTIFAREMILDIDKSVVLDSAVIDSPVMGEIAPLALLLKLLSF